MTRMIFIGLVCLVVAGLAYLRLAPSDPADWHVDPQVSADQDLAGGVRRRLPGGEATFDQLHAIILATPRTELLAGGPDDGRATYITRTKWMGYPDYTTVQQNGDQIGLYARLRFGASDLGVNKARVESWLDALRAVQDGD